MLMSLVGVHRLQAEQLGDHRVGDVVADRRAEVDDAVLEQLGVGVDPAEAVGRALFPLGDVVVHGSVLVPGRAALVGGFAGTGDDLVDQAVLDGLLGGEPAVAVGVGVDLLDGLAGVLGDQVEQDLLDVQRLLGLDLDVGGRAAHAGGGLVHHDPRVRQGVALALGAGAEQELAHRGGQAHADRRDVVGDVVHRVVDRHAGVDRATGAVDVEEDVGLGVLGRQQQQLRADRVGRSVRDLRAEEDDALAEEAVVDVVVESATWCFTSGNR